MALAAQALVDEVGAFYWTVPAPDMINSGREEQVRFQCRPHGEFCLQACCVGLHGSTSTGIEPG